LTKLQVDEITNIPPLLSSLSVNKLNKSGQNRARVQGKDKSKKLRFQERFGC
jgi:hypothetical protein